MEDKITDKAWAIKVKGEDSWYAIQRFPGFTTCQARGNPGIYDIQFFKAREDADKALAGIPEDIRTLGNDTWEVVDIDAFMEKEYADVIARLRKIGDVMKAANAKVKAPEELRTKIHAILGLEDLPSKKEGKPGEATA